MQAAADAALTVVSLRVRASPSVVSGQVSRSMRCARLPVRAARLARWPVPSSSRLSRAERRRGMLTQASGSGLGPGGRGGSAFTGNAALHATGRTEPVNQRHSFVVYAEPPRGTKRRAMARHARGQQHSAASRSSQMSTQWLQGRDINLCSSGLRSRPARAPVRGQSRPYQLQHLLRRDCTAFLSAAS